MAIEIFPLGQSSRLSVRAVIGTLALAALAASPPAQAALIQVGTPLSVVPGALRDPLATLTAGLPADAFLLPIEITGASNLQDWSLDITFDGTVVQPLDLFGLYQWVYQAEFSAAQPDVVSDITASGVPLGDVLEGVAGFSSGLSGDGVLAYLLFQFLPGQGGNDPGFDVDDPPVNPTPEPGSLALLAAGLAAVGAAAARRRSPASIGQHVH